MRWEIDSIWSSWQYPQDITGINLTIKLTKSIHLLIYIYFLFCSRNFRFYFQGKPPQQPKTYATLKPISLFWFHIIGRSIRSSCGPGLEAINFNGFEHTKLQIIYTYMFFYSFLSVSNRFYFFSNLQRKFIRWFDEFVMKSTYDMLYACTHRINSSKWFWFYFSWLLFNLAIFLFFTLSFCWLFNSRRLHSWQSISIKAFQTSSLLRMKALKWV